MIKRGATPLAKDRYPSKNTAQHNKPFRDLKNLPSTKNSLSRNSSHSRIMITPSPT